MLIALVLSRKRPFLTRVAIAATAPIDLTPKLLGHVVDCVAMTSQVVRPCKSLTALWPIATDPVADLVSTAGHVIIMVRAREGGGLPLTPILSHTTDSKRGIPA